MEIIHRARTQHRRVHIGRAHGHGDARGNAKRLGRLGQQRAQHRVGGQYLGQLVAIDAQPVQQLRMIVNVVEIPVIGRPVQGDGGRVGGESACELQIDVIFDFQEFVRRTIALWLLALQIENVCDAVLAAASGHARGQSQPGDELAHAIAFDFGKSARHFRHIRRAAAVHPDDGIAQGLALLIHRHRARPVRAHPNARDTRWGDVALGQHPAHVAGDHRPPVRGVLFGLAAGPEMHGRGVGLADISHDFAIGRD